MKILVTGGLGYIGSHTVIELFNKDYLSKNNIKHQYDVIILDPPAFTKSRETIRKAVEWADIVHHFFPFALTAKTQKVVDELGKPSTAAFHVQPQNITSSLMLGKCEWANNLLYRIFRNKIYDRFGHVHVPSRFMGEELKKRGYTAKIHAISNGIQSDFKWMKRAKAPEFEGKILIMMVGRLTQEKRQDILINAVKHSKYGDRIQLIFAGTGPTDKMLHRIGQKLVNPPIFGYYTKEELMDNYNPF